METNTQITDREEWFKIHGTKKKGDLSAREWSGIIASITEEVADKKIVYLQYTIKIGTYSSISYIEWKAGKKHPHKVGDKVMVFFNKDNPKFCKIVK